jgi:hypothetical protein
MQTALKLWRGSRRIISPGTQCKKRGDLVCRHLIRSIAANEDIAVIFRLLIMIHEALVGNIILTKR